MPAKDKFHEAVKNALIKDGWTITHDPLEFELAEINVAIDLGAEKLIVAERENQKIAVEVKSFLNPSPLTAFHQALGQFLNYKLVLSNSEPERILYLAVPESVYSNFFNKEFVQMSVSVHNVKIIVYSSQNEVITRWIK